MKKLRRFLVGMTVSLCALSSAAATFVGDRKDFRDETIYFAMTTRFYDGDPTNNVCSWDKQEVQIANDDPDWRGDFKGLIDKLDYIKALGFTAIWITPIVQNASGEDYHGYHAMDFTSVDLRYESRKAWGAEKDVKFQDLIDAAHAKGIKIVLDVVLQHTGNFGEVNLNPLFTRDQNIKNQASPAACLIPNPDLFSSDYFEQDGKAQYDERWKYFKNPQYEPNNYYHHYGTGWNWDLPNRWWGQIAGDCVDLNTENNYVAEYIVKCYSKFIEMGVDGFRIDTSGHISPLTFNKQFIPQFHAAAEKYRSKRLNGGDFFMFGEVCQRFQGSVVYRDQPNLSSYFYTWKSDQSLLDEFNGDPAWWRQQTLPEGHDTPVGPMVVCEKDTKDKPTSNNVWMQNGAWHEPDYSQASGFNVIDFPMHYSFSNAGSAIAYAREDNKYNDASYNVVYVDSHDYSPGPNDQMRFNGGTEQWAENLSLMFTFRGIPCIYYGSEVEFKAGKPIDVGGVNNKTPRKDSGRAYFGEYLEGTVSASDFGTYTASGNVATTLNGDLAQHVRRLNQIRASVPALRRGQYTFDGCSANGGWAYKRAYKDSYALVALNGGATFTGVPAGTYTDLVTGQTYQGGGSITVDAPKTKGQLRVLVKDWKGGKVGEDGKFIYASSPVAHGGAVTFPDKGASRYYTSADVVKRPAVTLNPAGGTFRTETVSVTASLNGSAESGWYQIGGGSKVNLTNGNTATFTLGDGMSYGETVTVSWGASDSEGKEYTGKATYKKVDPNAAITIYCKAATAPNLYAWSGSTKLNGEWPGAKMTSTTTVGEDTFYYMTFDVESLNIIFNNGNGAQTGDIENITEDKYFEYDGGSGYKEVQVDPTPGKPVVSANPGTSTFTDNVTVTLSSTMDATIYYTIDGTDPTASSTKYTQPLTFTETTTLKAFGVASDGTQGMVKTFTYTKKQQGDPDPQTGYTIFFDNTQSNWAKVHAYIYGDCGNDFVGAWPGKEMTPDAATGYHKLFIPTDKDLTTSNVIFTNNSGSQTGDDVKIVNYGIYNASGYTGKTVGIYGVAQTPEYKVFVSDGVLYIVSPVDSVVNIYSLDGNCRSVHVDEGLNTISDLSKGFYIVNRTKVIL